MKPTRQEWNAEGALLAMRQTEFSSLNAGVEHVGAMLVVALEEIIELKKLLNEHTHDAVVSRRGITTTDIEGGENDGLV